MILGALASAVLVFLSFPPADLGPLAWFALIPLLYALGTARLPWQGGVTGLIYGGVFFGLFFSYIMRYGIFPLMLLALFQGLFFGLFGWLMVYLRPVKSVLLRSAGAAAAWTLIEYLRSHVGPLSLTFGDLAYSQHQMLSVLQIASVLGAGAVTLTVVFANGLLASMLLQLRLSPYDSVTGRRRASPAKSVLGGYAVVFAVMIGGAIVVQTGAFAPPRVKEIGAAKSCHPLAIQGNVAIQQSPTEDDADQCRLVYTYEPSGITPKVGVDLVVWPETAIPVVLNRRPFYLEEVQQYARDARVHLLMGALEEGEDGLLYNTAYLFNPEGEWIDSYRKVDLVLFGEYVPNLGPLNALVKRYPVRSYNISSGRERNVMDFAGRGLGSLICWEAVLAQPTRELCRKGAQFLVFMTSDSWAAGSFELDQHAVTAPVRAVESRRFVVRAATMGPSAVISPYGRPLTQVPAGADGFVHHRVYPLGGLSIYHHIGDLPLLFICVVLWMVAMFRRPAQPPVPESR